MSLEPHYSWSVRVWNKHMNVLIEYNMNIQYEENSFGVLGICYDLFLFIILPAFSSCIVFTGNLNKFDLNFI